MISAKLIFILVSTIFVLFNSKQVNGQDDEILKSFFNVKCLSSTNCLIAENKHETLENSESKVIILIYMVLI